MNLIWHAVTWTIVRADRKRASVAARFERDPFRLVVLNSGPALAWQVLVVSMENVGAGTTPRRSSIGRGYTRVDLAPGESFSIDLELSTDLPETARVKLSWVDGDGHHSPALTLPLPNFRRSDREGS